MFKTILTQEKNPMRIVDMIKEKTITENIYGIMYFASVGYEHDKLADVLNHNFGNSVIMGSSSHAEFTDEGYTYNSIALMIFEKDDIDGMYVEYAETPNDVEEKLNILSNKFGEKPNTLNPEKYIGWVLFDGESSLEREFMEKIGDKTDIIFLGGSAGDDLTFDRTSISLNGKTHRKGCLITVIKPKRKFKPVLTLSFDKFGKTMKVDKVIGDDKIGVVVEAMNGKSALKSYSEALNIDEKDFDVNAFFPYPLGLETSDGTFVSTVKYINEDESFTYVAPIREGLEYEMMTIKDIIDDTRISFENAVNEIGGCKAVLQINCAYRTLQLQNENKLQEYIDIFNGYKLLGMSSYGEQFITTVSHSCSMILFQ